MKDRWISVLPVPCEHIYMYYRRQWERQPCLGYKFLMIGYGQCSHGAQEYPFNNLYGDPIGL